MDNEQIAQVVAEQALDELAPPKKELTKYDIGRLRRQFFTIQNPVITSCNHKIRHDSEPSEVNCQDCWFAFFQHYGKVTQLADEVYALHGKQELIRLKGQKFTKYFLRFMGAIASQVKEMNVENNGDTCSIRSTDQSSTGSVDTGGEVGENRVSQENTEQRV